MTELLKILCDSLVARSISKNSVHHDRNVEIDHHFIRKNVESEMVVLVHIPRRSQVADMLTKALSRINFEEQKAKLGCLISIPLLEGEC